MSANIIIFFKSLLFFRYRDKINMEFMGVLFYIFIHYFTLFSDRLFMDDFQEFK